MSDPSEMRARLVRLRGELADELPLIDGLAMEISEKAGRLAADTPDAPSLALAAVKIHRWYTALESVLQRIERSFAAEPAGGDWHLDLLRGAVRDLPGIRPAILPRDLFDGLHEILRFRHFFRHAYAVALDGPKLAKVALHVHSARGEVSAALSRFEAFLGELADRLA